MLTYDSEGRQDDDPIESHIGDFYTWVEKYDEEFDLLLAAKSCGHPESGNKQSQIDSFRSNFFEFDLKFVITQRRDDSNKKVIKLLNRYIEHKDGVSRNEKLIGAGDVMYMMEDSFCHFSDDPDMPARFDSTSCHNKFGYDAPESREDQEKYLALVKQISKEIVDIIKSGIKES